MSANFHRLRVAEIRDEGDGVARTFVFEVPEALRENFRWRPGQHLTLRLFPEGNEKEVLRAYTVSASPFSGEPLQITVKRHDGGHVSKYLNDRIEVGDAIEMLPPVGHFCLDPAENLRRTHYFFGAGSGITPLFSMLHSVLLAEPHSVAHLLYSNRDADSVIFRQRLDDLLAEYPDRLTVDHAWSKPAPPTTDKPWRIGRIDASMVDDFITAHPPCSANSEHFVCGPGGMNTTVRWALKKLDVPDDRIHLENFDATVKLDAVFTPVAANMKVLLQGETHEVACSAGTTVLDACRDAGLDPPYSCQAGVCGACLAKLTGGTVHQRATSALDAGQIDSGLILTCQAIATSEEVAIDYG